MNAIPPQEWTYLYRWAIRYANVCRNNLIEIDDMAQDMALALLTGKWKGRTYAKQVMRNHLTDMIRRERVRNKIHVPLDEGLDQCQDDEQKIEAKNLAARILYSVNPKDQNILRALMNGYLPDEIKFTSKRTVYRTISKVRTLALGL